MARRPKLLKVAACPRTFITYAQETKCRSELVRQFSDRLRVGGIDSRIDQYEQHPADGWPKWMEIQFAKADRIIVIPSKRYLERYGQDTEGSSGVRFEAAILRSLLMRNGVSFEKLAVALLEKADKAFIPDLLLGCPRYLVLTPSGYDALYRWLTAQPEILPPKLGPIKKLAAKRSLKPPNSFRSLCQEMGKNLYYTIPKYFEDRMAEHSMVGSCRLLPHDTEIIYEIRRSRYNDTVRVWLSDQYSFGDADFRNRPREIRPGDYILIAKPEASSHGEYSEEKIRVGKLADFMGALNKREMWKYEPPSWEEKKRRKAQKPNKPYGP